MPSIAEPEQISARGRGRPTADSAPDPDHPTRIALSAFAARGYEGASLRAIAARARVDPALLSRRYGSKLGLWKATVDELAERMEELRRSITATGSGSACNRESAPDRLRRALRLFVSFHCEVPELGRFFTDEIGRPGERRRYLVERIWRPHAALLRHLLHAARTQTGNPGHQPDGAVLSGQDADFAVLLLTGMVSMPLMMRSIAERECAIPAEDLPERLARAMEMLLLPPPPAR